MDELTFNEHIAAARAIADDRLTDSIRRSTGEEALTRPPELRAQHRAAAVDMTLAITHLDDANTRYNSGRYHQNGTWKRADPDRRET